MLFRSLIQEDLLAVRLMAAIRSKGLFDDLIWLLGEEIRGDKSLIVFVETWGDLTGLCTEKKPASNVFNGSEVFGEIFCGDEGVGEAGVTLGEVGRASFFCFIICWRKAANFDTTGLDEVFVTFFCKEKN